MVDDVENVSAFAVYSGKVSNSKTKKKKKMIKQKNLNVSLNKSEKMELLQKKKMKKERALSSLKSNGQKPNDPLIFNTELNAKLKKIIPKNILNSSISKTDATKKKKKKKNTTKLEDLKLKPKKKKFKNVESESESAHFVISDLKNGIATNDMGSHSNIRETKENDLNGRMVLLNGQTDNTHKKFKKLRIIDPEIPVRTGKFKKPVISTPRVPRRLKKVSKITTMPGTSTSSKVLESVDMYLLKKKEADLVLSADVPESSDNEQYTMLKLAEQARIEVQSKGSEEACGRAALEKILQPHDIDEFFKDIWERKPLHIIGKRQNKFLPLISTEMIDHVLRDNIVLFGKHLDVTIYENGKRETHNMEGRANAHVVWDFYSNGCSVRLLNPQYFMNSIHTLNASLQEWFGCFVGANVYLTPPNSQGFAPHYDDIEAFILQVEGSKIWRIYPPLTKDHTLPRFSSRNFADEEIGEPIMEVKVSAGDVLYFPRGFIHQGRTESEHSLHITLSVYQKTAWVDLLEKLLPLSLQSAASQDVEFRKGLPIGYLKNGGLAHKNSDGRKQIVANLKQLLSRMVNYLETDAALDQMGLSYVKDALPPVLTPNEAVCSVAAGGWRMEKNGHLKHQTEFSLETAVRWIRSYGYRILEESVTLEDGTIEVQTRIYYTLDNSREYHKDEPQFIIIPPNMVPGVLFLAQAYPNFTKICDLPAADDDERLTLVGDLWDRGLLMTDKPLNVVTEDEEEAADKTVVLSKQELEVVADLKDDVPLVEAVSSESEASSDESSKGENDALEMSKVSAEWEDSEDETSSTDDDPALLNH